MRRPGMTDDELIARAFVRGFAFGCEQAIVAHDGLIDVIPLALLCIRNSVGDRLADDTDERVMVSMHEVRRLRDCGAIKALEFFEFERSMEAER